MKREKILVDNRRNKILDELKEHGQIKVEDLAEKWNVSPLTIRRDLLYLEEEKKIERFYGGASLIKETEPCEDEVSFYRRKIAEYAASLVNDGDSIFINSSMTALQMVKYLGDKRVTVITNNGRVMNLDVPPSVSVVLVGGELRHPKYAMVGEIAIRNIENITVKKSFLGCSGLNVERGSTTEIMNEVHVNKIMFSRVMEAAYIMADHTKIGKNSSFVSQNTKDITHVITDELAPKEVLSQLAEYKINIYQVKKEK